MPAVCKNIPNYAWLPETLVLPFRLGEITLGRARYAASVLQTHFSELTPDLDKTLTGQQFARGVEAFLLPSHPVAGTLPRITVQKRRWFYIPAQYRRYTIPLSGDYAGYLQHFSAKTRKTLRREARHFAAVGGGRIDWRQYAGERLPEFYELARRVSAKSFQERLLGEGLPKSEEFLADMHQLAAKDAVRGYLLFIHGEPVAYLYCPCRSGHLHYSYLGYDPVYRSLSPGTVLLQCVLERLFAEQSFAAFDFDLGESEYKKLFATASHPCADIYVLPGTVANLLVIVAHTALASLSRTLVRGLEALGVKSAVKGYFRRRATRSAPDPAAALAHVSPAVRAGE
jgi:CelD/BcsL family acetyltransferase involved in cellulose biosynthesis